MDRQALAMDWQDIGRRWIVYSGVSAVAGVAVTLLVTAGVGGNWLVEVVAGAIIGVSINTTIIALEVLVVRWLDGRWGIHPALLRVPHYVVGGILGFLLGEAISSAVLGGANVIPDSARGFWLPFIGVFSVAVGLLIYGYEALRRRLQDSIAELKEKEYAAKELELARSIQQRLLPPKDLEGEGFTVAARNLAARWVAGDFYDVFRLGNGDLGLVVADVAGKGIGASLIMASAKAVVPFIAAERSVAETLAELNRRLAHDLGPREFVALAFARYTPSTGALEIGNAGLPDPFLQSAAGDVRSLPVPGPRLPLGALDGIRYESAAYRLAPGDRVLLFSDGLPESRGSGEEPLGYERLEALLPPVDLPARDWLGRLFASLPGSSAELDDDWTALLVHRHR